MTDTQNSQPYQLSTPEGRAIAPAMGTGGAWTYEYDYKDHLGNTRLSYKEQNGKLLKTAQTAYDPWGMVLAGIGQKNNPANRWELQGKEKESTFGLNRIQLGARSYNPTIGRWDGVDPLAEKRTRWSTYNYVRNNPINRVDPNGALDEPIYDDRMRKNSSLDFSGSNTLAVCPTCPNGKEWDWARNSSNYYEYDKKDKSATMITTLDEVVVSTKSSMPADAYVYGLGFDFAFLGGMGYTYQVAHIKRGNDQGWHFYHTTNANIGFGLSAGFSAQEVDFIEEDDDDINNLDRTTFEGKGNNFTIGVGAAGFSYGNALKSGKHSMNPMAKNKLYRIVGAGLSVGVDGGIMWQGTNTVLTEGSKYKK
jgi:RHS repeat-associated protein